MGGIEARHLDFTGRRVLVTGAAGGLGSRMALAFHAHGGQVVLADRDVERLAPIAAEIGGAESHAFDQADPASVEALARAAEPVDVLLNNAGILHLGPFLEMSREAIERMIATNLTGPIPARPRRRPWDGGAPRRGDRQHGVPDRVHRRSGAGHLRDREGRHRPVHPGGRHRARAARGAGGGTRSRADPLPRSPRRCSRTPTTSPRASPASPRGASATRRRWPALPCSSPLPPPTTWSGRP